MTRCRWIVPLLVVVANCSFVRFLHPLFEPADLIFDPALLGSWQSSGSDSTTLVVTRGTDARYELRATDDDDSLMYVMGMGRIGAQTFWDLIPSAATDDESHLASHLFAKVAWSGDELRLTLLNEQWLVSQILQRKISVPYDTLLRNSNTDTTFVILASSSELKRLIGAIASDTVAFRETTVFRRRPPGAP